MTDDPSLRDRILTFWLDEVGPEGWYAATPELNAAILDEFGPAWSAAMAGRHDRWMASPKGALALLILLDQFPRNMFEGAKRFASDSRARQIAKFAIGRGLDLRMPEPGRQFFYLPLMHSEVLADQERCVCLILLNMPKDGPDNLPHAVNHREVIRRFGRFPSRNAALGRADSDAERAYRAEGGYMSGAEGAGPA